MVGLDQEMTIPPTLLATLAPALEAVQGNLKKDGKLVPVAFIISREAGIVPITFTGHTDEQKDGWAHQISMAASTFKATAICIAMESWSLKRQYVHLHADIQKKWGSLSAAPESYKLDVVSLSVETPDELWVAQCSIRPLGISKRKKTFDLAGAQWQRFTEAGGRFAGLLPGSRIGQSTVGIITRVGDLNSRK